MDAVTELAEKEKKFNHLLEAKAEKIANIYLNQEKHTQLSFLPKEQQEHHRAMVKGLLLDKVNDFLSRF